MTAVLMDTNALIWFLNGDPIDPAALQAIAAAQNTARLYISPISAWEAALAPRKANGRPHIPDDAATWFKKARSLPGAKLVPIGASIAIEAAKVPAVYGRGDPDDCYIIATARVKHAPVVTRDGAMIALSARDPTYLQVIVC